LSARLNVNGNESSSHMQMYSPEELDVMAEAYLRAVEQLPRALLSAAVTQRLVQEIAWAVANGARDENAVARKALSKVNATGDAGDNNSVRVSPVRVSPAFQGTGPFQTNA
jgi:hypothetical protein